MSPGCLREKCTLLCTPPQTVLRGFSGGSSEGPSGPCTVTRSGGFTFCVPPSVYHSSSLTPAPRGSLPTLTTRACTCACAKSCTRTRSRARTQTHGVNGVVWNTSGACEESDSAYRAATAVEVPGHTASHHILQLKPWNRWLVLWSTPDEVVGWC
ncbi:uncharacterized protein LOC129634852 isoform X4 [Bubalus kerabau]|uniref:uncharacterized protein LOC129634852 isoform X4 n=1 Tax=Bubalus carabanensis TaxID=3119969 RepID=UPI00244E6445|nr:uncharacterized protein LOC129634852 isoform X4 [Bubalus carabanensis]